MIYESFVENKIQSYLVNRFGDMPTIKELSTKGELHYYQMNNKRVFSWEGEQVLFFDSIFCDKTRQASFVCDENS